MHGLQSYERGGMHGCHRVGWEGDIEISDGVDWRKRWTREAFGKTHPRATRGTWREGRGRNLLRRSGSTSRPATRLAGSASELKELSSGGGGVCLSCWRCRLLLLYCFSSSCLALLGWAPLPSRTESGARSAKAKMATEGTGGEPGSGGRGEPAAAKREFDVDSLSKAELRMLLSVLEGELEARDLVIEALRSRRKEVFIQERYGRFNLSDPFLALQRDYETGAGDKDKKSICTNPLSILEAVMAHCRKMQERMAAQLIAAENRQKKLEMEKCQLEALEMEHKKLCTRLEEERGKNKHVVLMLVKECKQLSSRIIEEAQKLEDVMAKFEEEKKKANDLEESLAVEKQRSTQMEAQMEKQLSEFDTEREQLHVRLGKEEAHTHELKEERERMRKMIEQLKKENESKSHVSLPRRNKDRGSVSVSVGTEGPTLRTFACQTDTTLIDVGTETVRKLPLTVPLKPSAISPLLSGQAKMNVSSNAGFVKPTIDRHSSCSDLLLSPSTHLLTQSQNRIEENGPSTSPEFTSLPSPFPNNTASSPAPGIPPQTYLQASSMHHPQSPSTSATGHQGWSPSLTPLLMSGGPAPLGGRPTLLHQAAAQGNVTLLSMLLNEEGLDINESCEDGYSALYSAAMNGHTDCVRLLLTSKAQVDPVDKNGFTPLCSAVAQGHCKCAELLIKYHADVNHAAERGETPLFLACGNGNNECVKLLLEAGADRSATTCDGWTPFHAAVDADNVDCLRYLMCCGKPEFGNVTSDGEANSCIFDMECDGDSFNHKARAMVSADLINHADKEGWTAAHIAASKGFKSCLEVLCSHGGLEAERKDKCNRTVHDVATDDCKHLLENLNALKMPLRIAVSQVEPAYSATEDHEMENTICVLNIRKQTAWDDFSKTVSQAVTNHFQAIASDEWRSLEDLTLNSTTESSIGLTTSSILSIKLGNISWSVGQTFSQPPWDFLKRNQVEHIVIYLLGPPEGCLHSVSYASTIHLQTLQNYFRLVEQYRNIIFHGPEGSLQDYVADQIALCMKHKQMAAGFCCEIVKVKIDADFSKEQLAELFINSACLIPVKQPSVSNRIIVILEDLEKASLSELLGEFLQPLENRGSDNPCTVKKVNGVSEAYYFHENCFLLGTIAKSRLQGSDLMVQQHFLWVQLRWDGEPIHGLLQRFLRRKVLSKFRGMMPPPCDPVCKIVEWILVVWHQLNSCLSRLGAHEALVGPKHFMSCPVVPGHSHATVKWMSKLWNAIIAPRVQEAILSRASLKRPSTLGQLAVKKSPSQGQQAVVKAALSILLNKAVLHGCPLPRAELDQYIADFKGGNFPLSMVSTYKNGPKKRGEGIAWRKVSTSPRKKSGNSSSQSWSKKEENIEGVKAKNILQENGNRMASLTRKNTEDDPLSVLNLEQKLSLGSDDEVDLVQELQSICLSKSESDISKIVDSKDDLIKMISTSQKDPVLSANIINANTSASQQDGNPGICLRSSSQTVEYSNSKPKTESVKSGVARAKSFLPVPKNKVSQSSQNTKRSSSNTRQIEAVNDSKEEIWNMHKKIQLEKYE
ncbi:cortactin-binding protein 2 isoform X2 [Anolis carolinensis]|uniref:cortactin-binding protein 2 isoform X2 n=1 Tax=Anolis carolinensis TaxID=28377 RepID=UPI002F2B3BD7